MRQAVQELFGFQQAFGLQVLKDLGDLGPQGDIEALWAQCPDLVCQMRFHLVA
ncbi:hypothetical protein D9M72_643900 [compost metagenome]